MLPENSRPPDRLAALLAPDDQPVKHLAEPVERSLAVVPAVRDREYVDQFALRASADGRHHRRPRSRPTAFDATSVIDPSP